MQEFFMKTTLTKILFTAILFSAAVPSVQAGVLTDINDKLAKVWSSSADFSKQVEKKAKETWDNKWVRYSSYVIVGTLILYAALAHDGHLPKFSAVKSSLIRSWQEKNLKALRHTFEETSTAKTIQMMTERLIAERLPITDKEEIILRIRLVFPEVNKTTQIMKKLLPQVSVDVFERSKVNIIYEWGA